jgi:hypothetical protein
MKYNNLKISSDKDFRRVTGVKRQTFYAMLEILKTAHQLKKSKGGRPNKLSIEDMLLMGLEYLREYRTYISISRSYGISESNTFETIKWVENTLIKDGKFSLPGKKALLKSDMEYEVILIDATESPIQRPKKNNASSFQEKRSVTL